MPPMRITSRGFAAVTVGLVSAVVLAGCSSNSTKPTVLPSLQTTSTAPTSAAATTPASPPSTVSAAPPTTATRTAQLPSRSKPSPTATKSAALVAEVTQFVRTYYATVTAAQYDVHLLPKWRAFFIDTCAVCAGDYNAVKKELQLGARYEGGGYSLKHSSVAAVDADGALVYVNFVLPAAKAYDKAGKLIDSTKASALRGAQISVDHVGGRWHILSIKYQDPV
jgi:hypothetical protein